jgi:hypothetical protein
MGKLMIGLIFITTLALIGWAVDPQTLSISEAQPPTGAQSAPQVAVQPAIKNVTEMTPAEDVTQKFYDWYVAALESGTRSPLADGAYRASPYLSTELVHELDGILASFGDGPRYDPILFSSILPRIVSVHLESLSADEARVSVRESWPNSFQDLLVRLQPVDGQWKLVELTRPVIDTRDDRTPQDTVRVFYNWYTEYAHRVGNPLIDRAYQDGALSPELQNRLEAARLSVSRWPADDPILLGRDLAAGFDANLDDSDGAAASVWVRGLAQDSETVVANDSGAGLANDNQTSTLGDAGALYVSLQKIDGRWLITDVADKPTG